jgi:hypothetical protein
MDRFKGGNDAEYKLTPFKAGEMAREAAKAAGLGPRETEMLVMAAMASVG